MPQEKKSCLIMMASYNGERFIKEQIESIIAQTYQNWRLIIQDDGSTDCTVSMIEQFVKTDPRICMFVNDSGKHGPYQNFNALVNKCRNSVEQHDLYFFADQDDCWDRDKIEKFTAFYDLHAVEPDKPVLIYGDMRIIDQNGIITHESLNSLDRIERTPKSMFFDASVWGCNMMFNRALLMDIQPVSEQSGRIWGHDQYFARWAGIRGELLFFHDICMSYRRYGESVTAEHVFTIDKRRILDRLNKLDALAFDHAVMYKSALFVIDQLKKADLSKQEKHTILGIQRCIEKGGITAIWYFAIYGINLGRRVRTASHLFILALGIYKKHLKEIQ